jgi:hypothetical protein
MIAGHLKACEGRDAFLVTLSCTPHLILNAYCSVLATPSDEKPAGHYRLFLGIRLVGLGTGNKVQLNESRESQSCLCITTGDKDMEIKINIIHSRSWVSAGKGKL